MFLYGFSSSLVLMLMLVSLRGGPKRSWRQEERRRKGQKMTILTPPPFRVWEQKNCLQTSVKRDQKSLFCGNDSDGKRRKNQLTQGRFPHLSTLFFHKSFKFMSQESSVGKQTSISISTLSLCTLGFPFSSLGGKSVKPSLSPLAAGGF